MKIITYFLNIDKERGTKHKITLENHLHRIFFFNLKPVCSYYFTTILYWIHFIYINNSLSNLSNSLLRWSLIVLLILLEYFMKCRYVTRNWVTAKPLISSKKNQDAVIWLPYIAQVPNNTSRTLTWSYSPIEGEDEGPSPLPRLKKVVVKSKKLKSWNLGSGEAPVEKAILLVLLASDFNKNTCYFNNSASIASF